MQFTYNANSESVEQALESFQNSLADNSPALKLIADDFREMISEQFATEGAAGGTPWAGLAPSTLRARRGGSGILNSTSVLLASLTDPDSAGHVEKTDGQSLSIGSSLPYALFHQTGAGRGFGLASILSGRGLGRGLPMRPIIVLTEDRSAGWVDTMRQGLSEKALVLGGKELGGKELPIAKG
jgi:phage gpG-like protein